MQHGKGHITVTRFISLLETRTERGIKFQATEYLGNLKYGAPSIKKSSNAEGSSNDRQGRAFLRGMGHVSTTTETNITQENSIFCYTIQSMSTKHFKTLMQYFNIQGLKYYNPPPNQGLT